MLTNIRGTVLNERSVCLINALSVGVIHLASRFEEIAPEWSAIRKVCGEMAQCSHCFWIARHSGAILRDATNRMRGASAKQTPNADRRLLKSQDLLRPSPCAYAR